MQAMLGQEWLIPPFDENWLPKYRLQAHYLSHGCFISERLLFRSASRIANVPTIVLHGTHDWICPPENARRLIRFLPNAEMRWVARGTHTCADVVMAEEMRQAILDMQELQRGR
jgi:proline iminopeptidase